MTETIVAAFDSASAAEAAVQDLERAKIPSAVVRSYTKEDPDYTGYRAREPEHQGGFWSWLLGEEPATPPNTTPTIRASPRAIPL